MNLTERQTRNFLFAVQGVGVVFVVLFLAAYLAGLPTTVVYHSEPIVRLLLGGLGITLLVLILIAIILAALNRGSKNFIV